MLNCFISIIFKGLVYILINVFLIVGYNCLVSYEINLKVRINIFLNGK